MFNKNSIDSYRVRSNNVMSLAFELHDVVEGWKNNTIKRAETVKLSIEETIAAVESDGCLDFSKCSKDILLSVLKDYKKVICDEQAKDPRNPSIANHMLFYLDNFTNENDNRYLLALLETLKSSLFNDNIYKDEDFIPVLSEIDRVSTSLGCELLRLGYSKVYLYEYFQGIVKNGGTLTFEEQFDNLYSMFMSRQKKSFTVLFVIGVQSTKKFDKDNKLFPEFVDNVPQEYIDAVSQEKRKKLISTNTYKYYINTVEELDYVSAIKVCREKLSTILDTRQLGANNINISIPYSATVFFQDSEGNLNSQTCTAFSLDGSRIKDPSDTLRLSEALHLIDEAEDVIEKPCRDRIYSALRHLRIGDNQTDIEQKFINYWIGLEFIFSSPANSDSTFPRLNENMITIMTSCYVRRNRENLNNYLYARKRLGDGEKYWEKTDLDDYINDMPDILMKYHLRKMKGHLHHSDKIADYIKSHKKNLTQHISRLYRVRNELIHEAAIRQNIENTTSNLRYYLVFMLNQVISYCSTNSTNKKTINMESFFWHYECQWKRITISKYDLGVIMTIPFETELLK